MLKTVDGKRQLSAVTGPEAINLSFSFRSTAGVQRLSSSAAFDGGRQALTFGGNRSSGYKLVFQLAFGCRSSAALVFGGFRRWTASVNFRQLPGRRLLDFGSHRTASAAAFGGIDSER